MTPASGPGDGQVRSSILQLLRQHIGRGPPDPGEVLGTNVHISQAAIASQAAWHFVVVLNLVAATTGSHPPPGRLWPRKLRSSKKINPNSNASKAGAEIALESQTHLVSFIRRETSEAANCASRAAAMFVFEGFAFFFERKPVVALN